IRGERSHEIIRKGLEVLINLTHRGAAGCDPETGDGAYTLTATAVDTNKQSVAISEVQAIVDSVDLTQEPPSCRSMDRTTRSTRSSGLSGRPHDRGMARCEVLAFNYYRLLTRSAS
ncbi:MAG: hypothetical protein WBW00_08085, partial [Pseudolabrys sp.]